MSRFVFLLFLGIASTSVTVSSHNKPDPLTVDNGPEQDLYSKKLGPFTKIDSICVVKSLREMTVFYRNKAVKKYKVALGYSPLGAKCFQGDGKTPEGLYYINGKNPQSIFYKNLGISYPSEDDRKFAARFKKSPGGDIKIHGWPNGYDEKRAENLAPDWTLGCIAVTNTQIDELFRFVEVPTPILILP